MHIPRGAMVALLTPLFSLYMISMTAAKRAGGGHNFKFEYVTVTLLQELCKFVIAYLCFQREAPLREHTSLQIQRLALFGVPALLYGFDNNFQYVILEFLQPTELAVLWNFKIFATVVLMHCFLGRRYTSWQWAAVLTLVLGCALTQVPRHPAWAAVPMPTAVNSSATAVASASHIEPGMSTKLAGVLSALVGSTVAASSNVYCEWLVKQQPEEYPFPKDAALLLWHGAEWCNFGGKGCGGPRVTCTWSWWPYYWLQWLGVDDSAPWNGEWNSNLRGSKVCG